MTPDTIAIIASIVVSFAGLHECMARLEGLFDGFTRREPAAPGTGAT